MGEHPTQALLDLYTIQRERGQIDGLRVGLAGDLKHGRTVHSLSRALAHWDVTLTLISPPALALPPAITGELRQQGLTLHETDDLAAARPSLYPSGGVNVTLATGGVFESSSLRINVSGKSLTSDWSRW